jgi:hypothetical protein
MMARKAVKAVSTPALRLSDELAHLYLGQKIACSNLNHVGLGEYSYKRRN